MTSSTTRTMGSRLKDGGIAFHLSEVKGLVMDRLKRSHFLQELTGKDHLTHFDAVAGSNPDPAKSTQGAQRH
jgi:sulfate permease, SulP family